MATLRKRRSEPESSGKRARARIPTTARTSFCELPYHILLEIFLYAFSAPSPEISPSPAALLGIARLSRNLVEPALAAMYFSPCTTPPARAHQLLNAIRQRPELGNKVKTLVIDVYPLLSHRTPGHGTFNLAELVHLAKGLQELWLCTAGDRSTPPRRSYEAIHWQYPWGLFDSLAGSYAQDDTGSGARRLRAWRWDGQFMTTMGSEELTQAHLLPPFQTIRRLSLVFIDTLPGNAEPRSAVQILALLPQLTTLEIESSELLNAEFLAALPEGAPGLRLKDLTITNCPGLTAASLLPVLLSPICAGLRTLSLRHNRGTDLSFLSALSNTPALETLSFDGLYFSDVASYKDTKPSYDSLFPAPGVAHWPRRLTRIGLVNLRKWSADECWSLLQSLWTADLPALKFLNVYCIIDDLGWRERATFRDTWVDRMKARFAGYARVETKIDNARPTETHFVEDDFLEFGSVLGGSSGRRRGGGGSRKGGAGRARTGGHKAGT